MCSWAVLFVLLFFVLCGCHKLVACVVVLCAVVACVGVLSLACLFGRSFVYYYLLCVLFDFWVDCFCCFYAADVSVLLLLF